jgi:hypothetical protein
MSLISLIFFPSITCRRGQFLRQNVINPVSLPFTYFMYDIPLLLVILIHFSHDRSNWSSTFFSSTTFQTFPGVSDLLPKQSKLRHHIKLYSKCSILLVSTPVVYLRVYRTISILHYILMIEFFMKLWQLRIFLCDCNPFLHLINFALQYKSNYPDRCLSGSPVFRIGLAFRVNLSRIPKN